MRINITYTYARIIAIAAIAAFLFGFNASAATSPQFPKWDSLVEREKISEPERHYIGNTGELLRDIKAKYSRITYTPDIVNYGASDYWATRAETIKRGAGDCEDLAIAAYFDLLEAGFPENELHLVVAIKRATGEFHAYLQAADMVLDQTGRGIISLPEADKFYSPLYAINRNGWEIRCEQCKR